MPRLSDFLSRFRPIGAPGSAARAGVPADRAVELRAELDPVFTLLAATNERCATDTANGRKLADQVTAQAQDQAARIAADGKERAIAARSVAADDVLGVANAEAVRLQSAGTAALPAWPPEADVLTLIELAISFVKSLSPDELPERDKDAKE